MNKLHDDFSAVGRVKMHLEAIAEVRTQMEAAKAQGDMIGYRRLGENLMALEFSLVGEASRLADLVKAA